MFYSIYSAYFINCAVCVRSSIFIINFFFREKSLFILLILRYNNLYVKIRGDMNGSYSNCK